MKNVRKRSDHALRARRRPALSGALLLATSLGVPVGFAAEEPPAAHGQGSTYYQARKGKVDRSTLVGWQVFHNACFGCHGVGAVGTDVAPDLTQRIQRLSPVEFAMTVLSRYRVILPLRQGVPEDQAQLAKEMERHQHGPRGRIAMPAWETDTKVKPHILDLYGYLRARADGVIGPGRPQALEAADIK